MGSVSTLIMIGAVQEEDVEEMWRCNNGECIALVKKRDGRPDCKDR